jgi:hypothetical protein
MIKKLILLILFLPSFVFAQDRISLTGNVFDGINFFPVDNANIYNFNSKKYNFTDKKGNFEISVQVGDTIIVSKSVYKQVLIEITPEIIKRNLLDVSLFYKTIVLREVRVYALPATYDKFKKEFLNTSFLNYYKMMKDVTISHEDRERYSQSHGLLDLIPGKAGEAVTHPITALYNAFSKKVKMDKLYREMIDNQKEVDNLPKKYNRELVTSLTGLHGEELLNFMTFCKFSYYDLVRWSPEFIITQIKNRFDEYEFYKALDDN